MTSGLPFEPPAILTLDALRAQALDAAAFYTEKTLIGTEPSETRAAVFDTTVCGFIMGVRWAERYYGIGNSKEGGDGGY